MKLGTGESGMKQKREFTSAITVPMFMIGLIIFIFLAINVSMNTLFIQNIDLGSLHWLTEQFGAPQRHFEAIFGRTL